MENLNKDENLKVRENLDLLEQTKLENKPKDKPRIDKQIKEYAISIVVAVVIALTLRNYVFARADVEGNSMVSTLHNRDVIFVEKLSLLTHSIKRQQIIIFDSKNTNGDIYVKRVIGIEGDEIEIKEGKVYLNGEVLPENYLDTNTKTNTGTFLSNKGKYTVPKDHVFVLGDNRGNSLDSRVLGPINIKDIKGHTIFRVYPFNKMRMF
jgi:signal peptidase I